MRILHLDGFRHIDNTAGEVSEEILHARLETISLEKLKNNSVSYVALSYCWSVNPAHLDEKDVEKHVIQCNSQVVRLGANLWSALWYLGKDENGPRAIWADALCINQADAEDKTQQVAMMGDIYRGVGCVIVWLGPQGHRVKALFAALSKFAQLGSPKIRPRGEPSTLGDGKLRELALDIQKEELKSYR